MYLHVLYRAVTEMDSTVDDLRDSSSPQATELFLRAVHEEQNGAFYEGMYCMLDFVVINEMKTKNEVKSNERMKCYVNCKKHLRN